MGANGIALRIGATFFFTLMVVCVKLLAGSVPLGQIVFFRSAVALIPLVLFLAWSGDFPKGLSTRRPVAHVLRCLLGCTALFASFASLAYLPLAHASIIGYLAPILAVVLARFLLSEQISRLRWCAVLCGFLGMLALIVPQLSATRIDQTYLTGALLAFVMAIFTAGAKIQIRGLARTEHAGAIAFYFALTCTVAGAISVFWGWSLPMGAEWLWLIGAGLAGGIAHIMMTLALQQSEISRLAPFEYLSLIFAVGADAALFQTVPGPSFYPAALMILLSMWLVTFRDATR